MGSGKKKPPVLAGANLAWIKAGVEKAEGLAADLGAIGGKDKAVLR